MTDRGRSAAADPDSPDQPSCALAGPYPILLDLDGEGVQLTDLGRSTVFMEGDEGLKHRTAWAGAGDGVLFYDADNDGTISDIREYVFTEWGERRSRSGPGDRFRQRTREALGAAQDDLAALQFRFDTDGDGQLSGTELTGFKVMDLRASNLARPFNREADWGELSKVKRVRRAVALPPKVVSRIVRPRCVTVQAAC